MYFGNLGEGIALWGLCCGFVGFFVGFKKILIVNIFIAILIMIGFFFGIGSMFFELCFYK